MTSDGGLRPLFRRHLPQFFWTIVETGLVSPGVPDAHGMAGPPARPFWTEFKQTSGWAITLEPDQVGWLVNYTRRGGRAFIAVRRLSAGGPRSPAADELWLLWGGQAPALRARGLRAVRGPQPALPHALLGQWGGGPAAWDWDAVGAVLA